MALTNQMSKASYTRGNKVTIVKNPENCGSKKFKFGVYAEHERGAYPKVGASGKIAKRIYGGWYLVRMDNGYLVKMRPAAFRDSKRVNQVMDDWNDVSDHPAPGLDLLIRTSQTEHLSHANQVLEEKVKALEAQLAENNIITAERAVAAARVADTAMVLGKENTRLQDALARAVAIANVANARYHELFNDTQEMRSKNIAQEQELARLRGTLMGIMHRIQPDSCEALEGSCDCDDFYDDEGEDCLGCESGVDCPQDHTCANTNTNTSGQWEVVNNDP